MKIEISREAFWRKLFRFAFNRWKATFPPDKKAPVGAPYVRDPDYPCDCYEPGICKAGAWICQGDGHYLCSDCRHFEPETEDES